MSPARNIVRPPVFSDEAIAVAHLMVSFGLTPNDEVLDVLKQIYRAHPTLSFKDFWGAAVLAQRFAYRCEGNA